LLNLENVRDWNTIFIIQKIQAVALSLEASEVLEQFLWLTPGRDGSLCLKKHKKRLGDELSDVLFWVLLMSFDLEIDIIKAF